MKVKYVFLLVIMISIGVFIGVMILAPKEKSKSNSKEGLLAESFIQSYLMKDDGRIQTSLTSQKDIYLSETVGLWLDYLIAKNDFVEFDKQVKILENHFLTKDYLVIWELQGMKKAPANAFIDDLRIMNALYVAGEQWGHAPYTKLANKISDSLVSYQQVDHLMVDFVELESKEKGNDIALSYIIPGGFDRMKQAGKLSKETYEATRELLINSPSRIFGFFPKSYHVPTKKFTYDQEVNLIDQFYVGYHRAQWGGEVSALLDFTEEAFKEGEGKLYGRYDGTSGKPVVSYEAVAVYALAILMSLEIDEVDFAKELYSRMKELQQLDESQPYYGGYIDIDSKETHTFDNLLALLAERKGIDEKVF